MSISIHNTKYVCIGNNKIKAEWLPRWYGVPHEECIFFNNSWEFEHICNIIQGRVRHQDCIILTPLRESSDYKQKLKELKLEKLLNGNDIR